MVVFGTLQVGSFMQGKLCNAFTILRYNCCMRTKISSAVLVHLLLPGLCNMLTRAFLAGGYARDKSNLEILMVALTNFLMRDMEDGGISDRPDDAIDVFHTFFRVAGLSLLECPGLKPIDPAYALPADVVNRIFFGKR